jgi:Ethanolamine utilization protein EutJ (predicted chaperonin)
VCDSPSAVSNLHAGVDGGDVDIDGGVHVVAVFFVVDVGKGATRLELVQETHDADAADVETTKSRRRHRRRREEEETHGVVGG